MDNLTLHLDDLPVDKSPEDEEDEDGYYPMLISAD